MCRIALALLRQILTTAVKWGHLERAPEVPKLKVLAADPRWLTADEAPRQLAELASPHRELVLLGLQTDLRIDELIAHHVGDVDATTRTLTVARSDSRGVNSTTKSGRVRHIPLTNAAWAALRRAC